MTGSDGDIDGGGDLLGLCWDHPRCTAPMAAAAAEWARLRPGARVRWDARPLAAFNDQPIGEAAAGYDMLFVDHPMMGETARAGCLVPLDGLLPAAALAELAADSIGGSHRSYAYAGHQWALAVDAACQVSAAVAGGPAPGTWSEVLELARRERGAVALPLYPSDALCALLSLSANEAGPATLIGEAAVEVLVELAALVDPRSYDLNPPALLDLMAGGDFASYVPLIFGYAAYHRGRLRFGNVPSFHAEPSGAVLGGAGLAVTGRRPARAAEFAAWVAGAGAQRAVVCRHGGQPASAAAWADPAADAEVGGFFSATAATIERAAVRPREPWWPRFQRVAGVRLAELLRGRAPTGRVRAELADILDREAGS